MGAITRNITSNTSKCIDPQNIQHIPIGSQIASSLESGMLSCRWPHALPGGHPWRDRCLCNSLLVPTHLSLKSHHDSGQHHFGGANCMLSPCYHHLHVNK